MTKKGIHKGWQTFENPPPVGKWVDVYCEDAEGTWRIDLGEWTGSSLGSVNNPWQSLSTRPLLWRPRHPAPLRSVVERAFVLQTVPTEPDSWVSQHSPEADCDELV